MKKFGLIIATAALVGLAAPAFAIDAGASAKARTPAAQADVNAGAAQGDVKAGVKSKSRLHVRHGRGVNKMAYHDRGLHRGFKHSRHYALAKRPTHMAHAKRPAHMAHAKRPAHMAKAQIGKKGHDRAHTSVTVGSGVSAK